ncbi:MAG TPA: PspC domain-containing protein [Kineosporiaceae bacterium]|nr:PspC domain-containing protein [Kineosporiaceae bacterium]
MSLPTTQAAAPGALRTADRPPLVRPQEGRIIGGVAAGLAAHLGWPVRTVRILLIASNLGGGLGVILYAWLWALVPSAPEAPGPHGSVASVAGTSGTSGAPGAAGAPGASAPGRAAADQRSARQRSERQRRRGYGGDLVIGSLLLVAGGALLGARLGVTPSVGVVLPILVVIGGAVLAYSQLDEVERSRWVQRTGVGARGAVLRVVAGLVIVLVGVLLFVVQGTDLASAGRVLTATAALLGGTALVLAPWGVRLWRDLDTERAARVRQEERADIAAHLHDSVLQTLALIQRHSGDGPQVARLARAQERDLRDWLYGPRPTAHATVAGVVRAAAADVEDRHGVAVDLVVVGDGPVDDRVAALVAALREAMVNAVRHAGAPVSVYVEVGPEGVEAFVRDRGAGFDLLHVPADRLGVRESIVGRMERHGGTAKVRSDSDGTEVRLTLPVTNAESAKGDVGRDEDDAHAAHDAQEAKEAKEAQEAQP